MKNKETALTSLLPAFSALLAVSTLLVACEDDNADTSGSADTDTGGTTGSAYAPELDERSVLHPIFAPNRSDFLGVGWPSDYYADADGNIDWSVFPNPNNLGLIEDYTSAIGQGATFFGTNPIFYMGMVEPWEPGMLPTPSETMTDAGGVQLLRIDEDGCGERAPVQLTHTPHPDDYLPANTMRMSVFPGFPLPPSSTWALVFTEEFGRSSGVQLSASDNFYDALNGAAEDTQLNAYLAPVQRCWSELYGDSSALRMAIRFTTTNPYREMDAVLDAVDREIALGPPSITSFELQEDWSDHPRVVYYGTYETPIYQQGTTPYAASGGDFVYEDGLPVVQRWEEVPFTIAWQSNVEGSRPTMLWVDGTGADDDDHLGDKPALDAYARGMAIANFVPQFHGTRAANGADNTIHTFNVVNPFAGRVVFLQQSADALYFTHVLEHLAASPEMWGEEQVSIDPEVLLYGGHSQGAIIGALLAGATDRFEAFMMNGLGAYLSITVAERRDLLNFSELVSTLLGLDHPVDRLHPMVSLIQQGSEGVDPSNYARRWRGWDENTAGNHVFVVNGDEDSTTHVTSVNGLTLAAGLDNVSPNAWNPDPEGVSEVQTVDLPLSANVQSIDGRDLTQATWLEEGQGHFTIYRKQNVRRVALNFLESALSGAPIVTEDLD